MDSNTAVNQKLWDELAPLHAGSTFYDVDSFLEGKSTLGAIELDEVEAAGPVAGKRMVHLMCHFGMDTLSWARRGVDVTGVDFSAEALRIATDLSERTGTSATFVQSDVLEAADRLDRTYDIVFLSRGVLMWIQDIRAWARTCARLLAPGGTFYLLDFHPLALTLGPSADGWTVTGDYFQSADPRVIVDDSSYAVSDAGLTHQESREWTHPVGEVVSALIEAGIRIELVHEFPDSEGSRLPGLYSVRGTRV